MSRDVVDKNYRMSKGLKTFLAFLPSDERPMWKKSLSSAETFSRNVRKTMKIKIVKEEDNE